MAGLVLTLTFGLWCCLLAFCETHTTLHVSCRYRGVYHVEMNGRYNLLREEAMPLCEVLNSSLATMLQVRNAWEIGFETCRYGWIDGNIVIPRIRPNPICAANNTGVYVLVSNITDKYDAYCFNASETREKTCEQISLPENYHFHVPSDLDHPSLQDPQHPDGKDPAKGKQPGEGVSENETSDLNTEGSHHEQHPEGSSDQGAEEEVTNSPQPGDSSHVLHPGEFPAPGTEDTTHAPHTGDPHDGYHPGGFFDHGSHDDTTDGPHPGDPHHGSHVVESHDYGSDDDATDAPHPDDSGQDDHPGGSPVRGSDDTTDATHPDHSHHGHHPNESFDEELEEKLDEVTDEPLPDGSHYSVSTAAIDKPKRPGFYPGIDLTDDHHPGDSHYGDDATDAPQPGDSHQERRPAVSPAQGMDEDTTGDPHPEDSHHGSHPDASFEHGSDDDATGTPQPGDSDHGSHAGGSPGHGSDDTTDATHPSHSHHGHHPIIPSDQEPDDVTDDPLPDESHHSTSATEKPKIPVFYPGIDDAVTDSLTGAGHPYVNVPGVTESDDSDMSNFVDSNAGADKSHAGGPHQTKHSDKDESHSGNGITYTDSTPGSHEDHAAGDGDSESHTDDNFPDDSDLDADFATTEEDPMHSKPTRDPEDAIDHPDGAQPGGDDGPASTSNGDRRDGDRRDSGHSPNGESEGAEGDSAASGGLFTTRGPGFKRQARIPDWVIIVISLVSLAVILAVCIAVNSRIACGHSKKLVINGSGGANEGGRAGEMNGDPSKSQEMVNLVPKEQPGDACDPQGQLVPPEGMHNQQKRDMRIGV